MPKPTPEALVAAYANASPEQRKIIEEMLVQAAARGRVLEEVYEHHEPPMDEFIHSKNYLGLPRGAVYPKVLELLIAADDPSVREVFLCVGKGAGKSTIASILKARAINRLSRHYRDPASYFQLLPGALIAVITMSPTAEQAENVMFDKFQKLIINGRCFHNPDSSPIYRHVKRHIEFPKNVHALSGHSNYRAYFGYDVFTAILDEFSWFMDTESHDVSEEIYQGVKSSAETRFPNDHKIIGISTPQAKDDALYSRVDDVIRNGQPVMLGNVDGQWTSHTTANT